VSQPKSSQSGGAIGKLGRDMEWGADRMQILYDSKADLLYLRLDDRKQELVNRRVAEDIVLDMGEGDRIVGIEILDASKHLTLERLLPVTCHVVSG
jgi:uncharacterized protein YuzE